MQVATVVTDATYASLARWAALDVEMDDAARRTSPSRTTSAHPAPVPDRHRHLCSGFDSANDDQCLAGAATTGEPGALLRGGSFGFGRGAGPLAIMGGSVGIGPSIVDRIVGFRCAR